MSDERQFDFQMGVVDRDASGDAAVRWDRAVPLTVRAPDRAAAFAAAWAMLGEAPRHRTWTARINSIAEVTQ